MARIRHETFYSLASLNQRIRELLERLNNKVMKKMGYSRAELFIQIDKPALKPLPIMAHCPNCHGFYGASSMERLPTEQAIKHTIQKFKEINRG
ncbi:hypothetical protein A4R40_05440 [Photorhabdus laumondii subsp. laumondii]|nr:hypothetical protein A4R40_05440 [Photorhabdus laumondii subsp. laumondii]